VTFFFAWIDPDEDFDPDVHSREDEKVFAFEMTHSEGDFASLAIDIKNPRANLIAPTRKLWAWFSKDGTPIFKGRLIAMPEDLQGNVIRLSFVARGLNFAAQKQSLANDLKVFPFFDYIWIDSQRLDDPDVVLEARAELWHIDRVTHDWSVSSITSGEDGVVTLNHFYDTLKSKYGSTPLRAVTVNATVTWDQIAVGEMDMTQELCDAFALVGTPLISGRPQIVSSYTGQGLMGDWPAPGTDARGGWSVSLKSTIQRIDGVVRQSRHKDVTITNDSSGDPLVNPATAEFFVWEMIPHFPMAYSVSRSRIETVTFRLESDIQPLVTDPGGDDATLITISSSAVGEPEDPTDPDSKPPIGDVRRRSYMMTNRGLHSFEYLLMLARATLLGRARAVELSVSISLEDGLGLSCRKDAIINDPRLPAGTARGKIIEYRLSADGDGKQKCDVTIGCTVGEGNTLDPEPGLPEYVDDDYVEDYQMYDGAFLNVDGINYKDYRDTVIKDDGIDFLTFGPKDVITNFTVTNGETIQAAALGSSWPDIQSAVEALNAKFTDVILELKPLEGGPFETDFNVPVSELMIPKTLEL
jgi:hypothetical protein